MKKTDIDDTHARLLHDARQAVVADALNGLMGDSTAWCDFSGFGWADMTHLDQLTEWGLLERRSMTAGYSEYRLAVAGHKALLSIDRRNERFYEKAQRG